MKYIVNLFSWVNDQLERIKAADFIAPLLIRFYLAPVMLVAGFHKAAHFQDIVAWFGGSLGLPLPSLMVFLATSTEIIGGFCLLFGFAMRLISIPLMFTMLVAATTAHWENGWFAIAPSNPDTSAAKVLAVVGLPGAKDSLANSEEISKRLSVAKSILRKHGDYRWLTEKGNFVILNNGIEFSVTYLILLLVLFFHGAGRYVSVDYWIGKRFCKKDT